VIGTGKRRSVLYPLFTRVQPAIHRNLGIPDDPLADSNGAGCSMTI
jgi:hypothetical protein